MRITEILDEEIDSSFKTLQTECSVFFAESDGLPLYKTLPESYSDFHRVKVRHVKRHDTYSDSVDMAFESERKHLSQRAIYTSGNAPATIDRTSFYVFPTNGFNFLYNTAITETDENHLKAFDEICEKFGDKRGCELFADVLKFAYTPRNLLEGMKSGAEIIVYGIPSYYALRVNSVGHYDDVLTSVLEV